jgi:hypothetical protein
MNPNDDAKPVMPGLAKAVMPGLDPGISRQERSGYRQSLV